MACRSQREMKAPLWCSATAILLVIPADAGIQRSWIPVFTGMTALGELGAKPPGTFR